MADRKEISTFVFLDLESTCLPSPGKNPSITEICCVAVHRLALLDKTQIRVLNKLSLCVNPMKAICPGASNITGLYNDNLEQQKDFDDSVVDLLTAFIKRLEPPVCFLAHNGKRFDFGLLRSELANIDKTLPGVVLCADTLEAFMALDGLTPKNMKPQPISQEVLSSLDTSSTTPSSKAHFSPNIQTAGISDVNLPDFVSKQNNGPQVVGPARDISEVDNVKRKLFASNDHGHQVNAPKRQKSCDFLMISGEKSEVDKVKRKLFCDESDEESRAAAGDVMDLSHKALTPTNGKVFTESGSVQLTSTASAVVSASVVANGTMDSEDSVSISSELHHVPHTTTASTMSAAQSTSIQTPDNNKRQHHGNKSPNRPLFPTPKSALKPRLSYSLRELHKRIMSEFPKNSHLAEADCMALLNIVHKKSCNLLDWFDRNAVPFNSMEYMYTPKSRKCLEAHVFPHHLNC